MKKPKKLHMHQVRPENGTVTIRMVDIAAKEFDLVLTSADLISLMSALRSSHEEMFSKTDRMVPDQPLYIHKMEIGQFGTAEGMHDGMKVFITDKIHHDYYFSGESQKEFFLRQLTEAMRESLEKQKKH